MARGAAAHKASPKATVAPAKNNFGIEKQFSSTKLQDQFVLKIYFWNRTKKTPKLKNTASRKQ